MRFSSLFRYEREVPREWQDELARVMPPAEHTSSFELGWESGEVATERRPHVRPVGRWVIYQVVPPSLVLDWQREMVLEPATTPGHSRIRNRLIQTGELLDPWWIIQGTRGGHKVEFSDAEKALLHLEGLPHEPPRPGSLPYAEFDQRVVRQIVRWDRLRSGYRTLKAAQQLEEKHVWADFRSKLLGFLNDQVQDAVDAVNVPIDDNSIGVNDSEPEPDWDEVDAAFVAGTSV